MGKINPVLAQAGYASFQAPTFSGAGSARPGMARRSAQQPAFEGFGDVQRFGTTNPFMNGQQARFGFTAPTFGGGNSLSGSQFSAMA